MKNLLICYIFTLAGKFALDFNLKQHGAQKHCFRR